MISQRLAIKKAAISNKRLAISYGNTNKENRELAISD